MLSSFVILLREGFEAFLIVAIILAYLRKSGRKRLVPVVHVAVLLSLAASAILGVVLEQGISPMKEAVLGLAAIPFVVGLVIHMWRTGPTLKRRMERQLEDTSSRPTVAAALGVFTFTALMIMREGIETTLMLLQVRSPQMIEGAAFGTAGAAAMAWAWARYGHRINVRRFFQVTGVFLLLFVVQIAIYSLHELSEALRMTNGTLARFHELSEPYSSAGRYGKWFPIIMVAVPALWLLIGLIRDRSDQAGPSSAA